MPRTSPRDSNFQIPERLIERMKKYCNALYAAKTPDEALSALFLLHAQTKDANDWIDEARAAKAGLKEGDEV